MKRDGHAAVSSVGVQGPRSALTAPIVSTITSVFLEDPSLKSKDMTKKMKQLCGERNKMKWIEGYTEQQIKNKLNSMKAKYKKTGEFPLLQ